MLQYRIISRLNEKLYPEFFIQYKRKFLIFEWWIDIRKNCCYATLPRAITHMNILKEIQSYGIKIHCGEN